jgi:hypothetical protein
MVPGETAHLTIFDITGRRVALVRGKAGDQLVWDGRTSLGVQAATGIYLWRLEVLQHRQEGKLVVVR